MAGTLNKIMLIGHLGDEVKMHYFEGGGSIGRFTLATNETYTNKQTNERVTTTEWHNITVRNKGAEICEKYLSKGDKVYIEGRLKTYLQFLLQNLLHHFPQFPFHKLRQFRHIFLIKRKFNLSSGVNISDFFGVTEFQRSDIIFQCLFWIFAEAFPNGDCAELCHTVFDVIKRHFE